MAAPVALSGGFTTEKGVALVVLASLAALAALKRGFKGVTISIS